MECLEFVGNVLRQVWGEFIRGFNAAANVDRLFPEELIGNATMKVILAAKTTEEGNRDFLMHLTNNATIESLWKFCEVLRDTARDHPRHDGLAKLLEDKLKQWKPTVSPSHVAAQRGAKGESRPSSPQSTISEVTEIVVSDEDAASRLGIVAALDLSKRVSQQTYTDEWLAKDPPHRKLQDTFIRLLSRLAKLFNKHIDDLKPFLRSRQKNEEWPYKLLEVEDIDAANSVQTIFTKIRIENCWLNTEILIRLINVLPDKKSRDKAKQYLDAYHRLLGVFSKFVLLSHIPDDDARLEHFRSSMFPKQKVTYDVNIEEFAVSKLLEQQTFLSRIFKIPKEAFHYLEAKPTQSTLVTWALAISIEKAFNMFQKAVHEFWSLKEHSIIKVEIEGVFQLHLRGKHLPYLIKTALQHNQELLPCTEHLSNQFLALDVVDYSRPKRKGIEPLLQPSPKSILQPSPNALLQPSLKPLLQPSGPLNVIESEMQEQAWPGDDELGVGPETPSMPPLHEGSPSLTAGSETTASTFSSSYSGYPSQAYPRQETRASWPKLLGQDDDDVGEGKSVGGAPPTGLSWSGIVRSTPEKQKLDRRRKEGAEKPHQAISADLGVSKLPVVSKVKHDPLSQDGNSDEESQPEGYPSQAYPRQERRASWPKLLGQDDDDVGEGKSVGGAPPTGLSWSGIVRSTPEKQKLDRRRKEGAEKPHQAISADLGGSKLPVVSKVKHDPLSQDDDSDEENQPEDYVPPMNLGVPSHHLDKTELDPFSALKGAKPSGVRSSGQIVHPSNVCLVCIVCLDGLNNKVFSLKNHCKDPSTHPLVTMVKGFHCPEMLTQIRPSGCSKEHDGVTMCPDWPNCFLGDKCTHPHSQEELIAWTDKTPTREVCLPCRWDRILHSGLLEYVCLTGKHPPDARRVVILDVVQNEFVHLHMPPSNCVNRFEHRMADCSMGTRWSQCQYPHSELEFRVWTSLRAHTFSSETHFHQMLLKTASSGVGFKATDRFVTLDRKYLFEQEEFVSQSRLDVSNYVARFQALLDLEEVVHWEKLRKYNGKYTWCEEGNEVLKLKMHHETDADIVYQSAMEATLFSTNIELTGKLCGVDKVSEKTSYLHVQIDSGSMKFLRRHKESLPLSIQVCFRLKEWYFRTLRKAVSDLPDTIEEILMPKRPHFPHYSTLVRDSVRELPEELQLDDKNKQSAFERIMNLSNMPSAPYLVLGPFGTGKTRLIAAAAWSLLKGAPKRKILIATHHIETANSYAKDCGYLQNDHDIRIVRVVSDTQKGKRKGHTEYTKTVSEALQKRLLLTCNLIVTTFIVSQKLSQMAKSSIGRFSHIFIDEGAQAREPETVAAFSCADKVTKIIIAGDHMQVGPDSQVLGIKPLKYGLGTSLLARLHEYYRTEGVKEVSEAYQSVLLSNYRCHSAILRLPGRLFYDSSLQSCKIQELHPDMKNPLTFVCTSLDLVPDCFDPEAEGKARDCEISTLFSWVLKCAESWPTVEWGRRKMSALCVILPSRLMSRLWKKQVSRWYEEQNQLPLHMRSRVNMEHVSTRVSWDIQGREYRGVFLSTSEPVDIKNYSPEESTKGICEPTVFNTIVTRAQSLIVACGNPFRILEVEANTKGSKGCWMEFFHRCIENKALLLSESISGERRQHAMALQNLETTMFEQASADIVGIPEMISDAVDSIIESYHKEFNKANEQFALGGSGSVNPSGWKHWDLHEGEEQIVSAGTSTHQHEVECRLWQTERGHCEAFPSVRSEQKFLIKLNNRRCAFEGALVKVVEIPKHKETGPRIGRVISILEQGSTEPVLCEVNRKNVLAFVSVDRKTPNFLNLPHIVNANKNTASSSATKYVTCFDPKSLKKGSVPKISDSIPLEMASNLLFLVQPLYWKPQHHHPIGAVVGSFPKGTSIAHTIKILAIQYQVPNLKASQTGTVPEQLQNIPADVTHAIGVRDHNGLCQVAFSVTETDKQCKKISIHVADVTSFVNESYADFEAAVMQRVLLRRELECEQFGTSVSQPVLSAEVLSHASFSDSAEPVVSFTVSFVTSEHVAIPERLMNYEIKPNTNVLCKYVLKFKDLQDILHGKLTRQAQTRVADIELLYKVAEKLHFDRKKHNGYSNLQPHSCSYPDAWKLVNEFSILANKVAALNIARSFPKYALMKVQLPLSVPGEGEIADLLSHLALFERLPPQLESKNVDQQKKIFLSRTVCDEVLSSLEGKSPDLLKAKQLLSLPLHHSHLLVRDAVVRDYTQREEYAVRKITSKGKKNLEERLAKLEDPVNVPHLAHYSLECVCSSITCPFESTFDIHTQKLLKHALTMRSHEGGEGKPDKLHQIAHKCNLSSLNASGYLTTSKSVQLANSAQISSLCVAVVIKQVKDDDGLMHFAFPFLAGLDFHSLSKIKLSTITGSSQLKSAEKMLNITAVSSSIRILKEPSFHCVTKDQGQELLVFRQSETAESTVTNLVQKSVFIAYEPDCLSVEPAQWSTVKEFVENPGQASARKLSTFLERLCPSKHKASGRTQTLSKSIRTKDLSDSKEAMSRTSLSKEQLQSLLQDYCNTPFVILKASIPFKPLQTLKMWIRADMEEYVATPKPQVLELSPDVRICLQHLSDPEACFTKGVMAESAKLQYSTINHYCRVWENLVLAEAVVIGSRETQYQSSIISDFMVKFSGFAQPQDCLTENYYEPSGEIYSVFPKSFLTSCQDIFRFEPGYFVCAKYEIDLDKACQTIPELSEYTRQLHPARLDNCARFVLHMIVQKVVTLKPKGQDSECEVKINEENSTIDSDVKVIFKMPSIPNARMSPLMKVLLEVNDFTCELQTLPMFLSIRRVYDVMMHLPLLEAGSLPLCVACGSIDDLSHLTVPSETEQKIKAIIEEYPLIYGRWTGDTSRQLNAQQKKSINCSLRNRFQLIQGPPGTGKSVTGAHIAYAFAMVNRKLHPKRRTAKDSKAPCVLYCAPTNAAVDAVFKMLADIAAKKAKDLRILRVYGRGIEKKFYPCPFTNSDVFSSYFSDYSGPSGLKHLMLHHVIHSDECPYSTELLELEDFFKACIDKKEIPSPSCRDQYRLAQSNAEKDVLTTGKYDIILCTCNESAGSRIRTHLSPLQCIVDEASMVTEPESMAPISISQQVVLIGDHKQLQPFVLSDVAKHNHMDVSLFERYINLIDEKYEDRYKCKLFVSLNNQYRMMRVICELPSDMFYDSNLKTDTINHSVEKREAFKDLWPREKYPLVFCHIEGKETVGDKITGVDSKKNEEEADKVAEIVKDMAKLASLSTDKFGANKVTVGVLTYYKAQVALIRDKLKKNGLQDCASVLSVDASQGSEYDFVILSTVRSKFSEDLKDKELHKDRQWMGENIGFVQTPHRLCVALTRTCLGLVIVGNSNLLQLSESWQPLIHWYKERKCIWQRNEFPILALKKKIEHTSVATIPFFKKKPIVEDEYGLLKEQRQWQEWVKTRVLGLADLPAIVETDHEYDLLKEQPKKWQEIF